jgi:hypothetical protein
MVLKALRITGLLILMLLLFYGCFTKESTRPKSTGKTNELLFVTDSKEQWNGAIGDTIRSFFGVEIEGLPQPEPSFVFINVAAADFTKLYQKFHNIIIIGIDPQKTETTVESQEDLWSQPQRIIKITAPNEESFFTKFNEQKDTWLRLINQMEIKRTNQNFEMALDSKLSEVIMKKFGFYLTIPGGFLIANEDENTLWLRHRIVKAKQQVELGILIYTRPYTDTANFSIEQILWRRNEVTSVFVEGPSPGSFMIVADDVIKPVRKLAQDFPAEYAIETRGLWEVMNDFMGGAFISYTFVDEKTNKLVTLDGYIYNPNEEKRTYLRQLQSIFYSLEVQH